MADAVGSPFGEPAVAVGRRDDGVGSGRAVGERELLDLACRRDPADLSRRDLDEPQARAVAGDADRCGARGGQRVDDDVAVDA